VLPLVASVDYALHESSRQGRAMFVGQRPQFPVVPPASVASAPHPNRSLAGGGMCSGTVFTGSLPKI